MLPDGRIAAPLGDTTFVGTNPQGLAITPDGRYVVTVDADQNADPPTTPPASAADLAAGYALTVVDATTMRVVSQFHGSGVTLSGGVLAVTDPQAPSRAIVLASDGAHDCVRVFDVSSDGTLNLESNAIALPAHSFPTTIAASDSRVAYVADDIGDTVAAIDVGSRALLDTSATGFFPQGIAAVGTRLLVSNEGLSAYNAIAPVAVPAFTNPAADASRSSSMMSFDLAGNGSISVQSDAEIVRMDPVPDGVENIGGAHPTSIVVRRDGSYAYVALAGVDRVATVALGGEPRVADGLDLRLFPDAPYGTQPSAEVLSRDDTRLYVAMAGLNAVAVVDTKNPAKIHRLGLIPTGWFPSAVALSRDGRYLFVADAKGVDGWGQLQRVDLKKLPLMKSTLSALHYLRAAAREKENAVVPPIDSGAKSNVIDRIVYISMGAGTFDAFLGDLGSGNGDPSLARFGSDTPNLHALAKTYAIADNFYVDDLSDDASLLYGVGGSTGPYVERTLAVNAARAPYDAHAQDPEDYPRSGYLFNALARAGMGYRDYGGLVSLSGFASTPVVAAPRRGRNAPAADPPGFGGTFSLDVPALAALDRHIDEQYAVGRTPVSDDARATEFVRDMGDLVSADQQPAFTYVWLPADGAGGVASADRAMGKIVEFLSHTPHWSSTAVFVTGDGVGDTRDHVNRARTYALVVSPLAKAAYIGHTHLSTASIVKTEEELLGLRALGLTDFLASDMADFFGDVPYPNTYQALP